MEHFLLGHVLQSKNDILDKNIFGNSDIKFNRNPLFPNIFKINDISDKNNETFVENQTIFNILDDERNWISVCALIKNKNQNILKRN